jgi:hypothetical protein|tara:strand:+ start:39 stop:731 length:693 start_codon:yes stop_codon:yes gene_type:complete
MLTSKEFVAKLESENEALFRASELQIKHYYENTTDKDELIDNFTGRMVNERMNMEEISREVAALPAGTDPEKLVLLSKQAHDEAKHFQFVKEVVEYLAGEDLDMQKAVEAHASRLEQKGAAMIKKYNCNGNPLMLGLYQLLAEGRAARNWAMMAKVIQDPFISSRYAKIAKDESFHATLGRMELEKLCDTQEAQDEINAVINNFRKDLFAITSSKTGTLEESAKLMEVYA